QAGTEESPDEQQKFMKMISHGQRGRMDDQRCSLNPSKSAPYTEMLFNLLTNTQSQRLDDQRVSLPSLPGLQKDRNDTSTAGGDSNYLCYMVSKVQVGTSHFKEQNILNF
uniref:Purkinje cell protein 2 n=1 Tax=Seriola lalandi dorsalis TaxID=1841481 RepID=A0A3B4X2D3_SERLL